MIEYITGILVHSSDDYVVVDHNGIGYKLLSSSYSIDFFNNVSDESSKITVYTELIVREDSMTLCGFATEFERRIFRILTSVSGIGMKVALSALSSMGAEQILFAISCGDDKSLTKIPGVGAKTAKRVILELKDKVGEIDLAISTDSNSTHITNSISVNTNYAEAIEALVALGYTYDESRTALGSIDKNMLESGSVEDLISSALTNIVRS